MDQEILKVFLAETNKILAGLEEDIPKVCQSNIDTIERLAHTLKGNAAQFGLPELSEAAKYIEFFMKEIKAGKRTLGQESQGALNNMLGKVKQECQKLKS